MLKSRQPRFGLNSCLAEAAFADERAELVQEDLAPAGRPPYELLSLKELRRLDESVKLSRLTSSEAFAALFDLGLKGVVPQLPGKQFLIVLL